MAGSVEQAEVGSSGANGVDAKVAIPIKFMSPTSESSGDTLNEDGSSEIRSDGVVANSLSSPFSPESLDFDNLSIGDASQSKPTEVGRYTAPFQRGVKNYNDSSCFNHPTPDFARRDGGFRTGSPFSAGRGGGANFRNSRTWMSADAQAMQEFMVIRNAMRRQFKNSEVSKWKYNDYIAHREAMLASQANLLANKVKAKEEALCIPPIPFDTQQNLNKWGLYGNFDEVTNLSRVLGEHTIWCRDWKNGKDDIAPWPSIAELKWEGDDRAKTGVGRYPPLPREQGPPGLPWNQLPCVEQYPIDQVARIPTMEDIYLPVDDQIEEEKQYLWSQDLEEAMDTFLDS
ncbi:hypothetical protein HBI56_201420 [Parastagonospora nodorum]|nr:hypothetical protein HBH61_235060 [Parastagonospora nodorum]KAH4957183.1 hypothetical protein HBI78_192550 [Parastagonospora nodorum]KAH4978748.1 hypothetical protein HBI76_205060 [Parastagonospora nodorum]KAH5300301.1 hypothetical protein HBI12_195370 [Parastagonospora nodorum]KAH5358688.1 hypothetical protein HBI33_199550 [Parastagonospora nodorum]